MFESLPKSRASTLQSLYNECQVILTQEDYLEFKINTDKLLSLMDNLTLRDAGLEDGLSEDPELADAYHTKYLDQYSVHPILFQDIFSSQKYNLCMWIVPKNAVLKLHDHPLMHVLTKVLYGKIQIAQFQWEEQSTVESLYLGHIQGGTVKGETIVVNSGDTEHLTPTKNNIHEFKAITNCAFLDLFFPPYDFLQGRNCQYFDCYDKESLSQQDPEQVVVPTDIIVEKDKQYFLKLAGQPEGFFTVQEPFRGEPVILNAPSINFISQLWK